ncbi:glycoside hydrolase family 16 protein [Prolixibacteraceae bacterium]|nr:glycoside hydrolase family 16 protein [Prolixibacteraceae bacterium]
MIQSKHLSLFLLVYCLLFDGRIKAQEIENVATQTSIESIKKKLQIVFEDDFHGLFLDHSKWKRVCKDRNNFQYKVFWRPKNVSVRKGNLVLTTSKTDSTSFDGTPILQSGGISSKNKFVNGFGLYEARIKIIQGCPGVTGAFWLMSPDIAKVDGSGRDGSEIDIIEMPWNTGMTQHAIHWDGYGDDHKKDHHVNSLDGIKPGSWHIFALYWTPDEYIFYVDGKQTWRTSAGGVSQSPNAHLLLTSNVLAPWGVKKGNHFDIESLPVTMKVDWVRVYSGNPKKKWEETSVIDGSMEQSNWVLQCNKKFNAELEYTTEEKVDGDQALKVTVINQAPEKKYYFIRTEQGIDIYSNKMYRLTFYAKSDQENMPFHYAIPESGGMQAGKFRIKRTTGKIHLNKQWKKYAVEFTTKDISKVKDQLGVRFHFPKKGVYYLDKVELETL